MFTSFTGNTRRPRQVNLGGRKTNPFGTSGGSGSQATLDRAQQERVQRQRERDVLNAARNIQRVWRGHSSRRHVSDELRRAWDAAESTLQPTHYPSEAEALRALQRLLRFASPRCEQDLDRIRHHGARLVETMSASIGQPTGSWPSAYLRLEEILLVALERQGKAATCWDHSCQLLSLLRFVADRIPAQTARNAEKYYRSLACVALKLISDLDIPGATSLNTWTVLFDTVILPLKTVASYTLDAYEAFAYTFLPLPPLSSDSATPPTRRFRDSLADSINYKLLANALSNLLRGLGLRLDLGLDDAISRLRVLGLFIYFHRYAHNFDTPEAYSVHRDFVIVISALLNSLPVNIIVDTQRSVDFSEDKALAPTHGLVTEFLKEQLLSLVNQEGIGSLLAQPSQSTETSADEKMEEARQLANYALALLRFFPRRGDEIRMWLYMGPSDPALGKEVQKSPAIKYFWEASKCSSVFATVFRDSRAAIGLLKPRTSTVHGSDHPRAQGHLRQSLWQPAQQEIDRNAVLTDEWRVILVFLELYTFVLKVTDDEEFFSAGKYDTHANQFRDSGLPLNEVKDLTTFLKNLGFTLYFNSSEITTTEDDPDNSKPSLTYFNPNLAESPAPKETFEPSIGGVAGLKIDYVKGLITGLLRMIYERDSRRKFLPSDHWLMTSRFDMTGFIPAVVEEEESRHKIQEEDADDMDDHEEDDEETPQLIGTSRTQQQRRLERLQRQQRKASRRRYLQAVAPRLEILQNMPFFIPFATRVQIFREFVHLDMTKRRGSSDAEAWRLRVMQWPDAVRQFEKHAANIRRENEFEDAFEQFFSLGQGLKEPIHITFMDQFGAAEAGIDGGGVTKEFLTSVTNRAFMPTDHINMFIENDQHLLYPNPSAVEEHKEALRQGGLRENSPEFRLQVVELLQRYEFLGRIIGKCLYEGILVDVNFAPFFLRKWALTGGAGSAPNESGYRPTLNDLRDLDEELYQGLHKLKTYNGDVEDFSLNFTVTDTVIVDHTTNPKKTRAITKELKPDGANTPVTNQNRLVYISYMARHRLQNQPYLQTTAFLRGLSTMVQPSWLSMFNQSELQTLISGTRTSIDVEDLRRNTSYGGTYVIGDDNLEHPTIQLFWKIMREMSDDERRAVLKFVTSTPRAPLLGFGTLNPRFSIRDAGGDQERLPSTSTCVNLLKLPMYRDEGVLKKKLLYSIFSGAGFDLS
ncbi:hypothetical protein IQ07DRAFT_562955 [Pyrenochaeta sp. DS3sAY3a]|nr:hypothetical protein IQ07DRAFT_562955 [Pyrenochaeta sp. DS3sAY3a]